ncbi:type I restriction-modification system, S subunit [Mycoplasma haemofelis str. Langford 1]|uniref:Type I restriction-modification system, S subunit n=1 Tax=Mycoplasma haemofelis (strain Langford 1) TaxID=941640 RepID=E8ZHU6_MYCHL|nr:restriction endonuclease subunit S [Mycoplasma haemofelis]CBY92717.1 type I restriction-modification system, S subunit [Mycoplasma haemofelis str. Langford 1]
MSFKSFISEDENVRYFRLGDVCKTYAGISFKSSFYRDRGFPIIKTRNIQDNQIVTGDLNYCDLANHKDAMIIKHGDVVMAKDGSCCGKIGINLTDEEFLFDSHVLQFIPNEKLLIKRYLYHFLLSCQDKIRELAVGSAIPGIRKSELEKIKIPVSSLEVQEKVASTLDKFREIEREISLRDKQYEYYRNYLIMGSHDSH